MPGIFKESIKGEKKYTKLLNNLLGIKGRDQTIFTKVNSVDSFDVASKFSKTVSKKMVEQKQFTIQLNEIDIDKLIGKINDTNNPDLIIEYFEKYKQKIFNTKKLLLKDEKTFEDTKNQLLEDLEIKKQKEKIRWKQYRRKVLDSNIQDNIWPLHIATLFISLKTQNKELYAPLLFKEVELNIKNENIFIKAEDSWKLNEKLLFMLSENGYPINKNISTYDEDIYVLVNKIINQLNISELPINLFDEFVNLKTEDIKNKTLNIHPGAVLGLFKPSGGNLRKIMKQIIDNDEIEEILSSDPNKNIYKQKIEDFILNNSENLYRIQPSNFSQDKALISSLLQDSIIWGPPGTGKSQVIANIISNVFSNNKTAIVMSQKKAALDVLKNRLGKIAPFALFILNNNKMIKSEFYKPLKKFVEMVENNEKVTKVKINKMISKSDLEMLEIISKTKHKGTYKYSLDLIEIFATSPYLIKQYFKLKNNYKYLDTYVNEKQYFNNFMNLNNIEYNKFLFFKSIPFDVKEICRAAMSIIDESNININNSLYLLDKTNFNDVTSLLNCVDENNNDTLYNSDEKYLVSLLSERIINKIEYWKNNDFESWNDYRRFANAVRAERRLPFKFMNDHISIIQKLFPIIITTPETNFINWEKQYFDYAILDESSQMFLEIGLPILYLAKIKVLAGDTQQMQPSRWFSTRDNLGLDEEEEDVEENAESLLDYAINKGIYSIMLNQNYRSSSAALMSFSAKEFYESKLDVLDKKNNNLKSSSIEVMNVKGVWNSGVNEVEAKRVIEIANEEIDRFKKIIILTFNSSQRQWIEKDILENHPRLYKSIEEENLTIRNIENIQGDEADLVIASVVYDQNTNIGSTYVARDGGKNALNVAISRAKDKMIVVKSLNSKNIKSANSSDFIVFRNWLEFLDLEYKDKMQYSIQKGTEDIEESFGETDSKFERDVIDFIKKSIKTNSKVKIIKQYNVGSYSIDIAFLNTENKFILGIEVDGYRYHNGQGFDKYLSDISRQEFLESKGYNIYRIKEIDFKINKLKIINDVTALLN